GLAQATGAHAQSRCRLLRARGGHGVLREIADARQVALTAVAEALRSYDAHAVRALALISGDERYFALGRLLESVKTGVPAFKHAHGKQVFEHLGAHPDSAKVFDGAMAVLATRLADSVLGGYDFSKVQHVADLGGGKGTLLSRILMA